MGWNLAPDVSFCIASGKAIFLDIRSDRYTSLPQHLNTPFVRWVLAGGPDEAMAALSLLEKARLIEAVDGNVTPKPCGVIGPRSAMSPERAAPGSVIWESLLFHYALDRTRRRIARDGLSGALAYVSMERARLRGARDPCAIAAKMLAAGAALGPTNDCLARSLALVERLHRSGSDGKIVFGVIAMPFGAHCWVQSGDQLLNDHLDRVSLFTPILAI